jgi:hypothetical protein
VEGKAERADGDGNHLMARVGVIAAAWQNAAKYERFQQKHEYKTHFALNFPPLMTTRKRFEDSRCHKGQTVFRCVTLS